MIKTEPWTIVVRMKKTEKHECDNEHFRLASWYVPQCAAAILLASAWQGCLFSAFFQRVNLGCGPDDSGKRSVRTNLA